MRINEIFMVSIALMALLGAGCLSPDQDEVVVKESWDGSAYILVYDGDGISTEVKETSGELSHIITVGGRELSLQYYAGEENKKPVYQKTQSTNLLTLSGNKKSVGIYTYSPNKTVEVIPQPKQGRTLIVVTPEQ